MEKSEAMGMTRVEFLTGMSGREYMQRLALDSLKVKERQQAERMNKAKRRR